MRDILFRGKRKDTGEWVYWTCMGLLHQHQRGKLMSGTTGVTDWAYELLSIDDDTISQYTGMKDKNGEYIFEGDILTFERSPKMVVVWDKATAAFETQYSAGGLTTVNGVMWHTERFAVVGNVYDNPELLEDGGQ